MTTTETASDAAQERGTRRRLQGVVVSTKMKKTITVQWHRQVRHPKFGKFLQRFTKLHAHDESEKAKVGDLVEIAETRPLSKLKRWRLVKVLREASTVQR